MMQGRNKVQVSVTDTHVMVYGQCGSANTRLQTLPAGVNTFLCWLVVCIHSGLRYDHLVSTDLSAEECRYLCKVITLVSGMPIMKHIGNTMFWIPDGETWQSYLLNWYSQILKDSVKFSTIVVMDTMPGDVESFAKVLGIRAHGNMLISS